MILSICVNTVRLLPHAGEIFTLCGVKGPLATIHLYNFYI